MNLVERPTAPLLLALAALTGPTGAQSTEAQERCARLEAEIPRLLELTDQPGLSIAVANGDGVFWSGAFGRRRAGADAPVGGETVFEAASLSKPVFAYVVLQLVDEGLFDLDRPLCEYAPYPDAAHDERHRRITGRMALSHTPGFPNWRPRGGELEILSEPGERWRYSGEGFVFLQHAVEALTGKPLDELAQERVFTPLGMSRTSFVWSPAFEADFASGHTTDGAPIEKEQPEVGNAAYSLQTTARDYATFVAAFLAGKGLSEGIHREALTPQTETSPGVTWGLGWGLEANGDGPAFWHWGHNSGYRAYVVAYPARDFGFVYFANGDRGMLLLRDLVELATGEVDHPALRHLNYDSHDAPTQLIANRIEEAVRAEGIEAGIDVYFQLTEEHPAKAFDEHTLARVGFVFLNEGRLEDAAALFGLNAETYPDSPAPHRDLARARVALGELELAQESYERAAELDSDDEETAARIAELRADLEGSG